MCKKSILLKLLLLGLLVMGAPVRAEEKVTVYAAASTTDALNEIGAQYQRAKGMPIIYSFAASSALAKQIEQGAPAEIFISADRRWMDYLQEKNLIVKDSRRNLLTNTLVLIAPEGRRFTVKMEKNFDPAGAFAGKWCTGSPDSIPVGRYAKQALTALGWWESLAPRLVETQDVRSALAFVERGECAAGIVYETDAKASARVSIVGVFPAAGHQLIGYPIALVTGAGKPARDFLDYLFTPAAAAVFKHYGFALAGE
ncbi:MAG: molybdate ABC transporter substrate-binding protein [Candidatus Competibacteraceae bacterium]